MCLDIRPLHASVPLSLQPLRELGRGRLLSCSGLPLPTLLPRLLLPAHHSTLGNVMSREKFRRTAPLLDPPVLPDPRIEEQGRIVGLALGRTALVTVAVVLALPPLTVRGRERRRRSSSRLLSSRERSRSRGDRSRSSDRYWGAVSVAHSCPLWAGIPTPTCARCRGKICTRDMTCDFCVGWSPVQWELFAKKRTYKERKRSRPSGSVPPAPEAMPRAGTSSEVPQPGTSSFSFSRSSGGQDDRGGVPGCTWCCVPGGFLHSRSTSVERGGVGGGSVSGHSSIARKRASVSSAPSGAGEGEVAQSQRTPPAHAASSVASPRSSQHARRRDESREVSEDRSIAQSSRASRSSDRGARKDRRARSRSDSSRDRGRCSRSRSSYRSRSRASKTVILSVAVLLRALSFSGRPVSILGSILVSPRPLLT